MRGFRQPPPPLTAAAPPPPSHQLSPPTPKCRIDAIHAASAIRSYRGRVVARAIARPPSLGLPRLRSPPVAVLIPPASGRRQARRTGERPWAAGRRAESFAARRPLRRRAARPLHCPPGIRPRFRVRIGANPRRNIPTANEPTPTPFSPGADFASRPRGPYCLPWMHASRPLL
ncbi:hypothetical protein BTH_II1246 [Burkholderia thailandensis E264]|uniref:Uncharacterized protein n=1 Tax=Burkholderia thailandensis (strain ATCC 700388 / DSM 13276 / CCUG 48851 / CIP 106301 / E264) TaxID=271848 RepID=Q2T5V7_BURTA|nr:hypothetical protein BTH_II1246 [Burkholderia thailandensis E264]